MAVCVLAAADTEYSLSPCPGTVSLRDNKIVLTRENLDQHTDFITSLGRNRDSILEDWEERGVVLQAWMEKKDACLEITVRQDEDAAQYYDLVNHPQDPGWKLFLSSHKSYASYAEDGYRFDEVDKKQYKNKNYVVVIKYKRTLDSVVYWGYMAKTVARGYTVTLDYQVYNRGLRSGDKNDLARAANTLLFTDAAAAPEAGSAGGEGAAAAPAGNGAGAGAYLQITSEPPLETNQDTFYVEGQTVPGAHLIGVLMRINSATPLKFYADANVKTGSFRMKVTIPEENVWLMTLNVEINDKIVTEKVFNTTTYKKSLLPISFDAAVPEILTSDELVLSGTTERGVTVQCIVLNGTTTYDKTVRPNGTGRFTFKIPTAAEAEYDITVVFSKRNFDTRRFTFRTLRSLSEEERRAQMKSRAVRPGYNTLVKNLDQYIGKILGYSLTVTDIRQNGKEWIITAAGAKSGEVYRNFIIFMSEDEPEFAVGEQHLLYGTCIGSYQIQSEEDIVSYPACDLLLWE